MNSEKKCEHEGCNCEAREGSRYCSDACEMSQDDSQCNCGHQGCR